MPEEANRLFGEGGRDERRWHFGWQPCGLGSKDEPIAAFVGKLCSHLPKGQVMRCGWCLHTWLPEISVSVLREADHALRPWLFMIVIHKLLQHEASWNAKHEGECTCFPRFVHFDDDIRPEIETAPLESSEMTQRRHISKVPPSI